MCFTYSVWLVSKLLRAPLFVLNPKINTFDKIIVMYVLQCILNIYFLYMCVCICMCVSPCMSAEGVSAHVSMYMWRPKDNLGCHASRAICLFSKKGFTIGLELSEWGEVAWPVCTRACLSPPPQLWGYQNTSAGSSISELHVCKVIILLTQLLSLVSLKMAVLNKS